MIASKFFPNDALVMAVVSPTRSPNAKAQRVQPKTHHFSAESHLFRKNSNQQGEAQGRDLGRVNFVAVIWSLQMLLGSSISKICVLAKRAIAARQLLIVDADFVLLMNSKRWVCIISRAGSVGCCRAVFSKVESADRYVLRVDGE